jgi:hypothetical protein
MTQITKREINIQFGRTARAAGWNIDKRWKDETLGTPNNHVVGFIALDQLPSIGWHVTRIASASGGERNLTPQRMTARELYYWLHAVEFAYDEMAKLKTAYERGEQWAVEEMTKGKY